MAPKRRRNNDETNITQPRTASNDDRFSNSAAGAEPGRDNNIPPFLPPEHSRAAVSPFPQQKQNIPSADIDDTNWETPATSSPRRDGSHLQPNGPTATSSPPLPEEPADHSSQALRDHDYVQQPNYTPLTDHNYFMSVPLPDTDPRVNPPPGFTYPPQYGRPKRQSKLPSKFSDYDLS